MKNNKKARTASEKLHSKDKGYKLASNLDFFIFIAGLLVALFTVRAFIFEPVRVDGESMQNTLQNDERCVVEKVSYWFTRPKAGDIVIVHYPDRGNDSFVKRVVATGGQTIELVGELARGADGKPLFKILVDGIPLDESAYEPNMLIESAVFSPWSITGQGEGGYTVPEGYVFVMGDHRTNSHDSRRVGPIPLSSVVGRVHGVLYPFNRMRSVD
ncbi:MAG: signal peptidase I [Clostridia bacterium]|nr:signal peptidase I [Clostridia bacterium]